MAVCDLSPAHSSARAGGVHDVPWAGRAMSATRNQGSQTLPSQQMQLYIIHRLLVSSGRGRAAGRMAALGSKYIRTWYTLGVFFHPAALSSSCLSQTLMLLQDQGHASPNCSFAIFTSVLWITTYLASIWSLLSRVLCFTWHSRDIEIIKICNRLLPYFSSHSWTLAWSLSKPVITLSFLWATAYSGMREKSQRFLSKDVTFSPHHLLSLCCLHALLRQGAVLISYLCVSQLKNLSSTPTNSTLKCPETSAKELMCLNVQEVSKL